MSTDLLKIQEAAFIKTLKNEYTDTNSDAVYYFRNGSEI